VDDVEELRKLIIEKTGMSASELEKLVEKRIKEFAGLLTEAGALYTIARDHGIELSIDESLGFRKKIAELKPGDREVSVVGRVTRIIPPRVVKRGGREIKYAVVYLSDSSGSIRLVLWGRDADLVGKKIRRGTVIEVINGKVESFRDEPSLSLGYEGRLLIDPDIDEELPEPETGELVPGGEVELVLRVLRSFPVRRKGDVVYGGFIGEHEGGRLRVVLWGERAEEIPEGATVRVFGRVKEGRNGLEIHVGSGGYLEILKVPERTLVDLKDVEEGQRVESLALVVSLHSKKPFTGKCKICGGEVIYDGRFVCKDCGSEEVDVTPMLIFAVDDGTAVLKAVLFGDVVRSLCSSFPEGCLERARELLGSYILMEGRVRKSRVTESLDVVVERLREPDFEELAKLLLKRVRERLEGLPERESPNVNKEEAPS